MKLNLIATQTVMETKKAQKNEGFDIVHFIPFTDLNLHNNNTLTVHMRKLNHPY
jgi:hypothetical protein